MLESTLSPTFPHNDPLEQAEFLRNRLFDRLVDARTHGPIAAEDLRYLLGLIDGAKRTTRLLAVIAEIGVVERLLAQGARLRLEVANPEGRSADLEVTIDDARFFLHLKRLNDPTPPPATPPILPPQIYVLETIRRGYRVGLRIARNLDRETLATITDDLHGFLLAAGLGDRRVIHTDDGLELASAIISAPSESDHVELVTGIVDRAAPLVERAHRLVRRAYRQFVPGAENVILLIGGDHLGGDAMDLALLGSHEERWDQFPRQDQHVALGRAGDGLWHGNHFERSHIALWLEDPFADGRFWHRTNAHTEPTVERALRRFFENAV